MAVGQFASFGCQAEDATSRVARLPCWTRRHSLCPIDCSRNVTKARVCQSAVKDSQRERQVGAAKRREIINV